MRSEDFEYLYQLEERYWWFAAMRTLTDTVVAAPLAAGRLSVLDAGCGTGYNLRHYHDAGHTVFGFDIAPEAIAGVRRRGFRDVAQASVTEIPFASGSFDMVFSFDVLEQIPVAVGEQGIREMFRVLKPGGSMFIRVPAFEWMRSSHDEDIRSVHRFTVGELRRMMTRSGFSVVRATYINTFLFPIVVVRRLLKGLGIGRGTDVKPLPKGLGWLDPVFHRVLSAEAAPLRAGVGFPFGLSAICYGQKPALHSAKI